MTGLGDSLATVKSSFKHGIGGYTNHGCKCEICTEKWREYHTAYCRKWRARNKAKLLAEQALNEA